MKQIKALIQPFMLEKVLEALQSIDELPGVTISEVKGWGRSRATDTEDPVHEAGHAFARKTKLEIVVLDRLASRVTEVIALAAHTGRPGDGKIFVSEVVEVLRVRTGEQDTDAI